MSTEQIRVSGAARNNALIELLNMVKAGREFPDAHTDICTKYRLSDRAATKLTEEYDRLANQFTK